MSPFNTGVNRSSLYLVVFGTVVVREGTIFNTVILQFFGVVLFSVLSVVNCFTEIKKTPKWKKMHWEIKAASTDTEIKTKPNAPRSLATEILTHRKFVKLQQYPRSVGYWWNTHVLAEEGTIFNSTLAQHLTWLEDRKDLECYKSSNIIKKKKKKTKHRDDNPLLFQCRFNFGTVRNISYLRDYLISITFFSKHNAFQIDFTHLPTSSIRKSYHTFIWKGFSVQWLVRKTSIQKHVQ